MQGVHRLTASSPSHPVLQRCNFPRFIRLGYIYCGYNQAGHIRIMTVYDTLSYDWESNYVQNQLSCHSGAGKKLFLVAARILVAHLFLHGCACVRVIHKRILTVLGTLPKRGCHSIGERLHSHCPVL